MRRQTPVAQLLYHYLYPQPSAKDPTSFSAHLARNLVPEVRVEVATFYGDLNSAEARYPGLNYCYPPHRMRLGRFKHHRRLFEAFDNLGLTYNEIQDFCCWEGTRWARERYEKDEGVVVHDTTGDEIGPFVDRRERSAMSLASAADGSNANGSSSSSADDARRCSITRKTDISIVVEDAATPFASSSSANAVSLNARTVQHHPQTPSSQDQEMSDEDNDDDIGPHTTDGYGSSDLPSGRNHQSSALPPSQDPPHPFTLMQAQLSLLQQRPPYMPLQNLTSHSSSRDASAFSHLFSGAWPQNVGLPLEVEQFIKEQTERGTALNDADIAHLNHYFQISRRAPSSSRTNGSSNNSNNSSSSHNSNNNNTAQRFTGSEDGPATASTASV